MLKKLIVPITLMLLFFTTRFINDTKLPVFADEAIYIRWAQMIKNDPRQYLFLPLYDGKSPLFIWFLIPLLRFNFPDPLMVSRTMSAVFGLVTLFWLIKITQELGGSRLSQSLTALLVILLPYPLFHDRMGLIDSMLTAFLAGSFWMFLRWRKHYDWRWMIGSGVMWGLSLMTKTSAFYYAPVLIGVFLFDFIKHPPARSFKIFLSAAVAVIIGLGCIGWMRISPLFPFLFRRSSDFTFTIHEIITEPGMIIALNGPRIGIWLWTYFTPGVWLTLLVAGLINWQRKKNTAYHPVRLLLISASIFVLLFMVTGKLLASRYLLPTIIWLIPATALSLEIIWKRNRVIPGIVGLIIIFFCIRFALPLLTDPGSTPFSQDDQVQYLTDWSSGYGIPEIRDFLREEIKTKRVLVATEGFFGTLPDGLTIYFANSPLSKNLEIIGIGEPVREIRQEIIDKSPRYDETFLVVNQQRLLMDYHSCCTLVGSYPRPLYAPPLLMLRLNK